MGKEKEMGSFEMDNLFLDFVEIVITIGIIAKVIRGNGCVEVKVG